MINYRNLIVLFIVFTLINTFGLLYIYSNQTNKLNNISKAIENTIHQRAAITKMSRAAHERSLLILRMTYTRDIFEREELSERFSAEAAIFLNNLQFLNQSQLDQTQQNLLSEVLDRVRPTSIILVESLELMRNSNDSAAIELVMNQVLPSQDKIIAQLEKLSRHTSEIIDRYISASLRLNQESHDNLLSLLLWIILQILIGSLILYLKFQRDTAQLKSLEALNHNILDTAFDAIISFDKNERINRFNKATEILTDWSAQEILGRKLDSLIPHDCIQEIRQSLLHIDDETLESSNGLQTQPFVITRQQTQKPVAISVADSGIAGELRYTAIIHDLSDIKAAQNELEQSQLALRRHQEKLESLIEQRTRQLLIAKDNAEAANREKSRFLANMSHELRTPMHAIVSFADLGVSRFESATPEKLKSYFNRIVVSAERLTDLLNDLLDLSKLEAGKMDYDFAENDMLATTKSVINELQPLASQKNIQFNLNSEVQQLAGTYDKQRIMQVIRNILSNAIKFSPEETTISIELRQQKNAHDWDLQSNNPFIYVGVTDQGIGIPKEELEHIFDQFIQSSKTQTKAGGTGLGLSISREIIHAHYGRIRARNHESGATLEFIIPTRQKD